jgi:hypothetical protein
MTNLATNIAKHYENPARYAQLADADAFRMLKIIEMGGLAPLGPEVAQMLRACLDAGMIPKGGGTFTRLLRSALSAELDGLPMPRSLHREAPELYRANVNDAFLAYHSSDVEAVRRIAAELKKLNTRCWFDLDELQAGQLVQDALEAALRNCRTTIIFIGANGLGPWEKFETREAIAAAVHSGRPVIPVVLAGTEFPDGTPAFLRQFHAVFAARHGTPAAVAGRIRAGIKNVATRLN